MARCPIGPWATILPLHLLILTHFIHSTLIIFLVLCEYTLDRVESYMAFLPMSFTPPWSPNWSTCACSFCFRFTKEWSCITISTTWHSISVSFCGDSTIKWRKTCDYISMCLWWMINLSEELQKVDQVMCHPSSMELEFTCPPTFITSCTSNPIS